MKHRGKKLKLKRKVKVIFVLLCMIIGVGYVKIYRHSEIKITQPPERIQELSAHNKELQPYVDHYFEYKDKDFDKTITLDDNQKIPLLLQWDKRWGYQKYGNKELAINGCGPTCLSMVYIGLTGDTSYHPLKMAQYSYESGFLDDEYGTSWSLMSEGATYLGLKVRTIECNERKMKNCIDNEEVMIASMRPGDFTNSGHFIVIYDYDQDGFIVNDPNSEIKSQKRWSYQRLSGQIKGLWVYSR